MPYPFESSIVQVSGSVGTIASKVWDPSNTSAATFGALGSVPSAAVLRDVMLVNSGTANVYLNWSSQSAAAANGVLLPVGGYVVLGGYAAQGGTTANQIWGQTGTVGLTGAVTAGLATIASAGVI